jgi:hypothetical protein
MADSSVKRGGWDKKRAGCIPPPALRVCWRPKMRSTGPDAFARERGFTTGGAYTIICIIFIACTTVAANAAYRS